MTIASVLLVDIINHLLGDGTTIYNLWAKITLSKSNNLDDLNDFTVTSEG